MMHRIRMPPMQQLSHPERNSVVPATSKASSLRAMRVPKFLRSLYDILHYEDQSILTWSKDGTYFQIFDTKRLEIVVLPKYFKHGKFASFQRQLNNFGFRKWTKTQSSVCTFSHHHLVRCHPQQLAEFISRRPPTNGVRSVVDSSSTNKRKRTFTELMRSVDAGASSTAPKTIKRESDIYNRAATEADSLSIATNSTSTKCAPRWVTDPVEILKASEGSGTPTSSSSEQTFNFSVDDLHDIILPVAPLSERTDSRSIEKMLELRMLNECLDLGTSGSMYAASSHGSGELYPSLPYGWDCDTFFAPIGRSHFEQERGPWRLH
ncbi:Transient receptor potential Ca2 channel (TRP-CC) family protein [Phytophthora palmivora]|uniref:Transient receptor potential Ca2 channel (TRP-CC) family protein n=1 Tax=Phytophthora palmivora TaxID=4796 RepID=A0A2P4YPE4_9STRA|nr:Transient receptor potential Ca2 channel (TRP-CC) family protein [Phytophthora palmivora]